MEAMRFERMLMMFFGAKAYQSAGEYASPKARRDWLKKVLQLAMRKMDKIETTTRHKQALMSKAERAYESIEATEHPSWEFVYNLIGLIGNLLGYYSVKGVRPYTPTYWQTEGQAFTSAVVDGPQAESAFDNDEKDAVSVRIEVVKLLKERSLSDFKIALIMNATEYEIRKLRRQAKTLAD
jgi:hypothetical protein